VARVSEGVARRSRCVARTADVSGMCPRVALADNNKVPICRYFNEALFRTRTGDPLLDHHARTRAITRGMVLPANQPESGPKDASRGVARVVSDVSVLCPRLGVLLDNGLTPAARVFRRSHGWLIASRMRKPIASTEREQLLARPPLGRKVGRKPVDAQARPGRAGWAGLLES
jgi:hypothetical protein